MNRFVTPFLMFQGQAEEAIKLYIAAISESQVLSLEHWREGEAGEAGKVKMAHVKLGDLEVLCNDSPVAQGFTFTPSISLFVACRSEAEIDRTAAALGEGATTLMPLADYGFSRKFTWINDRFGVSWQLNLAA